jgi:2-polyprenyl-3-methyl-5-hydroxy-6-metoxy-1,4-benzoquinol methylase
MVEGKAENVLSWDSELSVWPVLLDGSGTKIRLQLDPKAKADSIQIVLRKWNEIEVENRIIDKTFKPVKNELLLHIQHDRISVGTSQRRVLELNLDSETFLLDETYVIVVVSRKGLEVQSEKAHEIRVLESAEVLDAIVEYSKRSQADKSVVPNLSLSRFQEPIDGIGIDLLGKKVMISGCGVGGEALHILSRGAKFVYGTETADVTQLTKLVMNSFDSSRCEIATVGESKNQHFDFDLIISRHVLEHIPDSDKASYLNDLISRLNATGILYLEVPNQNSPIEQHTLIPFFHWLPREKRELALRYLENRVSHNSFNSETFALLATLIHHENISLPQIRNLLPETAKIQRFKYFDSYIPDFVADTADTLCLWINVSKN